MITLIDLKQPSLLAAMLSCREGEVVSLCDVPKGGSASVSDDGWLMVDDGESGALTIDIGGDDEGPSMEVATADLVLTLTDINPPKWRKVF